MPPAPVTRFIVSSCALVAIGQVFLPMPLEALVIRALALVPAHLSASPLSMSPTLLTSLFVHGGWFHLLVNMMFLWLIGRPVEWVLGSRRYLLLYLVTGIAGGALQVALEPASTLPVVGASGAISGPMTISQFCHSRTCMSFSPFPSADKTEPSFPPRENMPFVRLPLSRPCGMR